MSVPFFTQAMISPGRQSAFRRAAIFHLMLLALSAWAAITLPARYLPHTLGDAVTVAGIIEGAALIGWRLVQLPKSQALEFLLVSPVQPVRVFANEAAVGLARLALIQLSGLPVVLLLAWLGPLELSDVPPLIVMPFVWGTVTGLGLTVWAYERLGIRRWGERVVLVLILIYLVVGVLAAERLQLWLMALPTSYADVIYKAIIAFFRYNPFGVIEYWLAPTRNPDAALERMLVAVAVSTAIVVLLFGRAAARFKGHFHDRHYRPAVSRKRADLNGIGNRPLSWWAVRRVMEYSGRTNIWLSGGFGLVYAAYILAGDAWPVWMGKQVLMIFDQLGGVPAVATALVVLAAVPASFQYGLWDASTQDRCKRLELLLLTELDGVDYWSAAAAAAWRRGRGYFAVALILWLALGLAGRASWLQVAAGVSAGVLLWGFSFALGFRAFSRGVHANGLGSLLTLGIPAITAVLLLARVPILPALFPPGAVYLALTRPPSLAWVVGPVLVAGVTLAIARTARSRCETELRAWYDKNQGIKVLD